jgi:septal ring factor EnvC (AmiA/AmiB activator)
MADMDTLIQGGVVAAGVSVASAFLTYRVAMRQAQIQTVVAAQSSELDREKLINETAELLRKSLLEEIQRLRDEMVALKHENDDLRKRLTEQDTKIFELRTDLAAYQRGERPGDRRQNSDPPPSGRERRRTP